MAAATDMAGAAHPTPSPTGSESYAVAIPRAEGAAIRSEMRTAESRHALRGRADFRREEWN
jgi:hypothetical protein